MQELTENACHALSVSPCTPALRQNVALFHKAVAAPRHQRAEGRLSGYVLAVHCEECMTSFQEQLPLISVKGSGANVLALLHTDQPQINNCNAEKISSNLDLFDGQNISMLLESDSYGPTRLL